MKDSIESLICSFDPDGGDEGSVSMGLCEHIRKLIEDESLLPNMRLPSGKALSGKLGIGYVSAQNALKKLAGEGLLVRHPRRGTVVAPAKTKDNRQKFRFKRIWWVHLLKTDENFPEMDDYFAPILQGVQNELKQKGTIVLNSIMHSADADSFFIEQLEKNPADAVLVARADKEAAPFIKKLQRRNFAPILISPHYKFKNVTRIFKDETRAACDIVNHLSALGHRRIGSILKETYKLESAVRAESLKKAISDQFLTLDNNIHRILNDDVYFQLDEKGRTEYFVRYFSENEVPSALIIYSDVIFPRIKEAAEKLNIRIPEDISIARYRSVVGNPIPGTPEMIDINLESFQYGKSIGRLIGKYIYSDDVCPPSFYQKDFNIPYRIA